MSKNPLEEKFQREFQRAAAQISLLKEFPDTIEIVDRWKKSFYSSKIANKRINRIEVKADCDCCEGAPVRAYPYFEFAPGLRIYSNPHSFKIGKRVRKGIITRSARWEEEMEETKIPEEIYDLIYEYLENNPAGPKTKKPPPEPDIEEDFPFVADPIPEDNFDFLQNL